MVIMEGMRALYTFLRYQITQYHITQYQITSGNFMLSQTFLVRLRLVCVLSLTVLFASCNESRLVQGVTQRQAIEIVALLHGNEVRAQIEKEKGGRALFAVDVDSDDYLRAMSLIKKNNLPSEATLSFRELVSQRSLLHNSRDIEALRLDRALAVEVEEALMALPLVRSAKVIVRKKFSEFEDEQGISVVVTARNVEELNKEELVTIVLQAIPGIKKEQIVIAYKEHVEAPSSKNGTSNYKLAPFFIWDIAQGDVRELTLVSIIALIISLLVGLIFGYSYASVRQRQHIDESFLPEPEIMSLQIDEGTEAEDDV